jgi:hypothetical protein
MAANAEASVTLSLIDRITGPIKRIGARIGALSKRIGMDRITGAVGRLGGSLRGLGDGLTATTGRLSSFLGLLGVGAGGAIASAYGLAKSAADVGAELTEMSGKLGLGVEQLQEYRFAAKMSGVEVATFDKGVEKLGINAVEASKGNKQLALAFKTLGVRVKGSGGAMRSTEAILDDTMSALAGVEDPLKRNALALKLFGKSGVDLTKMLGEGAEGLRNAREEARRTGNVMSDLAASAGDELGDNVDALRERLTGLKNFLGVQLIPVFNEAVKGITEWVDVNAVLIRSTVTEWAKTLTGHIKALINPASDLRRRIDGLAEGFGTFLAKVRPVVDFLGGPMSTALIAVTAWIVGPMVAAIATLAAAVFNLGVVIMSTPVGWFLGALALIGAAVYVLYQQWDEFIAYFSGAWDRVKAAFDEGFIQGISAVLEEFNPVVLIAKGMNAVFEYFTGIDLIDEGAALVNSLMEGFKSTNFAQAITEAVTGAWAAYEEWWNGFSANVRAAGAAIVQALWDGLKSAWGNVVAWFKGAVADLVGWLPASIQEKLGFNVGATVTGTAANDNASAAGAAVGAMGGRLSSGVPTGASAAAATAGAANDNAPSMGSGDVNTEILTNSGNSVTNTLNATVNITAPPGADAAAIGAAVRRELDGLNRRQAAAAQSALSD